MSLPTEFGWKACDFGRYLGVATGRLEPSFAQLSLGSSNEGKAQVGPNKNKFVPTLKLE